MTAFTTLLNALFIPGKPILGSTGSALRDNALAIAEADPSVALGLLPSVLLGTLTTTSGSTQTLSGLVLTPYRFLRVTVNGVSSTTTASGLFIASTSNRIGADLAAASDTWRGSIIIDLNNGIATSMLFSAAPQYYAPFSGYSTATTAISFVLNAGTFDAGSIRVYGEK